MKTAGEIRIKMLIIILMIMIEVILLVLVFLCFERNIGLFSIAYYLVIALSALQ